MDARAIEKAKQRLRIARQAVAGMEKARRHQDFSDKWVGFLQAAKGIYNFLEKGSKDDPKSRQWFGGKKGIRRVDPLLRYVFEARNDDEHGLDIGTYVQPGGMNVGVFREDTSQHMVDEFGNVFENIRGENAAAWHIQSSAPINPSRLPHLRAIDGGKVVVEFQPEKVRLLPVRDREGKIYQPPSFHDEKVIEQGDPIIVAKLANIYFESLIAEAAALGKP